MGVDVLSVQVAGMASARPRKGDPVRFSFTVRNHDRTVRRFKLMPLLRSLSLPGFEAVPVPPVDVSLNGGEERQITLLGGPFLEDPERGSHFALTRGQYQVVGARLLGLPPPQELDQSIQGGAFAVDPSEVVLVAVGHDTRYLNELRVTIDAAAFVAQAISRPAEVFIPEGASASNGRYEYYPTGLAQMMGVRAVLRAYPGYRASEASTCAEIPSTARRVLGLAGDWDTSRKPSPANHGFDMFVGLSGEIEGTLGCGGAAHAGIPASDPSLIRSQLLINFAVGANFGAASCLPLQGFVMCFGQLHPHYQTNGVYVWHQSSRAQMDNPFDDP